MPQQKPRTRRTQMLLSFVIGLTLLVVGFFMYFSEATYGFAFIVNFFGLFAIANGVSAIFADRHTKK